MEIQTLTPAHRLLEKHFGFREFLEGQEEAIQTILAGDDVLVVMPTGGGKSLCYQLPALMLEGITVVVSPLIALMKDQVDGLVEKQIPATFINSSLPDSEVAGRIGRMARGEYRLVYVAPERFKSNLFVETLAPLSIALFAIDEAHCISQWGHDFRPDYLRLKWALRSLGQPPVAALTATATPEVRDDIIEQLALGQSGRRPPKVFVSGFARHNLTLTVTHTKKRAEKMRRIAETIRELKTGIVYCATRKNVERVAAELRSAGLACAAYHGGMAEGERTKQQDRFMSGECAVAVATNAFGMGVDRPDLRFVLHHDIPGSVEAYYQEAGRAGRDGEPARCELLFNYADVRTQEFFIDGANPTGEVIAELYQALQRLCRKGPIEMPISEIAEHVASARNEMAVGTSLYLLERAGCIEREYAPGGRTYTTRLKEPIRPVEELAIDFQTLNAKRERDLAKLRRIVDYPRHTGCRHHFILSYFGDAEAASRCNVCDNCLSHSSAAVRLPTEEETVAIQKALSCVGRLNDRFGRGRITQVLVGSHSKEILDARLDRASTYGLLAAEGADYAWSLLDALIKAGCIAVSPGKYPVLSLTPLGLEVVHRRQTVPLAMPDRAVAQPAPERRTRARAQDAAAGEGKEEPCHPRALDALRQWRRQKAASMGGVPAYIVYPDSTLQALAARLPKTEEELLEVRGIGPAKASRFGEETLAVIRPFVIR
jgi:ATP-dependent DNA helicase RecQ